MVDLLELEERIEKCHKILSEHPDSQIFAALAEAYRKKGELDKAFEVCRNGLRNHPDYGAGHQIMAKINFDREMYSEAEKELLLAIKLDGRTRLTEQLLARIMIKRGEFKEAKNIVEKLLSTDKKNSTLKALLEEVQKGLKEEKKRGVVFTPPEGLTPQEEKPVKIIEKNLPFSEALFSLTSLPSLMAALVIGDDGLVRESRLKIDFDQENLGATGTQIFREIRENLSTINFGELHQFLLETEEMDFWAVKLKKYILLMVCRSEANLGFLKIQVEQILERLAEE
jgi:predicted regulator of Ras-like GTPase activity (Roadblock/LC7/MglB family)